MDIQNKLYILAGMIKGRNFKGYDPYDIRSKLLFPFSDLSPNIFKYIRYIVHHLSSFLTSDIVRKILCIKSEYC